MRGQTRPARRPFWLPASNYYVLAAAVALAFFFLAWGILHDSGEEMPWVTAGIGSSIILAGAVILREVVLRKARQRFLRQQNLPAGRGFAGQSHFGEIRDRGKLTLERNAAILNEIKQKSEAAKILSKFSAGHREVFELCREYIVRNEIELKSVNAGSPRLAALLKGRSVVAGQHRYHMLAWAEIEARALTNEARDRANSDEKIEGAQKALTVVETALASYPGEPSLVQSQELLREFIVSIKVSGFVELAERAAFDGDYSRAKGLYRDALFYLSRDNIQSDDREKAANRINAEIDKMSSLIDGV